SCGRHRHRSSAELRRSPIWPVAPSRTLSMTDSRGNTRAVWKVRTMPARAIAYAGLPDRSWPWKCQDPPSAFSNPVSTLKNVVLPAPLGPIRGTIEPWSTWNSSTDTATTPPKDRCTPETDRIGPLVAECAPAATAGASCTPSTDPSAPTEPRLLAVAEQALGPEHEQQHDRHADQHVPDRAGLGRGDEPPAVVADGLGQEAVQRGDHEPVDHRAERRADH